MTALNVENWAFAAAAALSALTTLLHLFAGGPESVKPLLASDLRRVPKYTNYYCWHLVSITLTAMAVGFTIPALVPGNEVSALLWTVIAAAFAIWSIALVILTKMPALALPQWALFTPIAALGIWGLL